VNELWDKRDDESDSAYTRFLIYRNLGVTRSLDRAYQSTLADDVTKRNKVRATGQWREDSGKHEWQKRAEAWDVCTLTEVGQRVVTKYINALDLAFQSIIDQLASGKIKPRTWGAIVESLTIIGNFIPQETVASVRQNNARGDVPAIGRGGTDATGGTVDATTLATKSV
jgi:hypothetical protein